MAELSEELAKWRTQTGELGEALALAQGAVAKLTEEMDAEHADAKKAESSEATDKLQAELGHWRDKVAQLEADLAHAREHIDEVETAEEEAANFRDRYLQARLQGELQMKEEFQTQIAMCRAESATLSARLVAATERASSLEESLMDSENRYHCVLSCLHYVFGAGCLLSCLHYVFGAGCLGPCASQ